jgi:hypothetical protein
VASKTCPPLSSSKGKLFNKLEIGLLGSYNVNVILCGSMVLEKIYR